MAINHAPRSRRRRGLALPISIAVAALLGPVALAQQAPKAGEPEVLQLRPDFYLIAGAGGNVSVQIGSDGLVLVDTGAADRSEDVIAAVRKLSTAPIRYILDTSADADHVGGNANLAKASRATNRPAVVLSTENTYRRMSAPFGTEPPFPEAVWPTETFFQKEKPLYLNGEGIEVVAQPAAHTDGDVTIFFRRSDVLVVGDIIDTTRFPVIDVARGGSIQGEIDALNGIIQKAIPSIPYILQPGGTFVVPGHGRVYEQADVVEYRDMVTIVRDVVADMIKRRMMLAQVQAADPTKGYRKRYGSDSGAWTTDMFVEAVYKSLTAAAARAQSSRGTPPRPATSPGRR